MRPEGITDNHLKYLDSLRASGATNMFGAGSYVEEAFDVSRIEAKAIVLYWMATFGEEDR